MSGMFTQKKHVRSEFVKGGKKGRIKREKEEMEEERTTLSSEKKF